MRKLALAVAFAVLGLAACKQESTTAPAPPAAPKGQAQAPAPAPTPAPAPSATPSAAVTIAMVTLGKEVGTDKKVTVPTEIFAKNDTIYASVDTTGSGSATIKARWTYLKTEKPTLVDETTQTITATGPTTTEFHVKKPDGWPAGEYQVEILVNDQPGGTKKFTVT